jgi:hypothetical protein
MKRYLKAVWLLSVCPFLVAAAPLTTEEIQRAVDEAAKENLGDFPPGVIRASDREHFYGSFSAELCQEYLSVFESFSATRELLRLPLPHPSPSEMLLVRPSPIESFGRP